MSEEKIIRMDMGTLAGVNNDGRPTLCLGIESSCDETAAAVVKNGREVLSSVISSTTISSPAATLADSALKSAILFTFLFIPVR